MDRSLFVNLFARLLLVACPVVAYRFARRRSLKRWQYLALCAAAGAVSNLLFAATVVLAETVWFSSTGALVSALAKSALYYAAGGLVFGAIALWRRVASTSRLILIGLGMVVALDLTKIVVDPIFGLPKNETRPVMLILFLLLGSLIYVWDPGAERELSVASGETEI